MTTSSLRRADPGTAGAGLTRSSARPRAGGWLTSGGPQALGLRLAQPLVRPLPRRLRYLLADVGGSGAFALLPRRARRARANYQLFTGGALAPASRLARGAFRNYARTVLDFLILERLLEELKAAPGGIPLQPLVSALGLKRGAIVVTPHLGNWDLGAAAVATCGTPVHAITDPFGPPLVDRLIRDSRERLGVRVIPMGGDSVKSALRALRRNEILLLACDIDKGGNGVDVSFLGRELKLPAGPATLSVRTGAPLIPGYVRRRRDGSHEARLLPALERPQEGDAQAQAQALTQAIATCFERLIREEPEQWFAFHSLGLPHPGGSAR